MDSITQLDDQIMEHWDDINHLDCLVGRTLYTILRSKVIKEVDNFVLKPTLNSTYSIFDAMLVFVQNKSHKEL